MALNGGAGMTHRLTLRLRRADQVAAALSPADIGRLLIALDAAVQACASEGTAPQQPCVRNLSLSQSDRQASVLHLEFDDSDDAPLTRLVAAIAAAFTGDTCRAEPELRDLQRALPQGVDAVEIVHGASSASIPSAQTDEQGPLDDQWVADLVHQMTHRKSKPFVPLAGSERLDFDVAEFNHLVAESRRGGE